MARCPKCKAVVGAPLDGGRIKCPKCGVVLKTKPPAVVVGRTIAPTPTKPPSPKTPARKRTKPCPACAEHISVDASKCPHCGQPVMRVDQKVALGCLAVLVAVVVVGALIGHLSAPRAAHNTHVGMDADALLKELGEPDRIIRRGSDENGLVVKYRYGKTIYVLRRNPEASWQGLPCGRYEVSDIYEAP